jgi:polyhydroxyalkanoate synthase
VRTWHDATETLTAQAWFDTTPAEAGSWWPVWERWLVLHSTSKRVAPPPAVTAANFASLGAAPGEYVVQK